MTINLKKYILISFYILTNCRENTKSVYNYPTIENVKEREVHFGISYINEFSNLENLKDKNVLDWYKKEDSIAENYFLNNPEYEEVYKHYDSLEKRDSSTAYSIKHNESGKTFYLAQGTDDKNETLYYHLGNNGNAEKLFDPTSYLDGNYEIEYLEPSYDGNYVALAMGKSNNFYNDIIILDCKTKKIIGNTIPNAKPNKAGGIVWSPDNKSILFVAYPNYLTTKNDRNSYTARYNLGKPEEPPTSIFRNGVQGISLNDEYYPIPKFSSEKSNYLFIYVGNASDYWDCYFLSTQQFLAGDYRWKLLFTSKQQVLYDSGIERNHMYFYKRINKDNSELCSIDLRNPNFDTPEILASGHTHTQIGSFGVVEDAIFYTLSENGISSTLFKDKTGQKPERINLPFSAGEINLTTRSPYKNDIWATLTSWTSNDKTYHIDPVGELELAEIGKTPEYPEFKNVITEVVEVSTDDGTLVPMSIIRRRDHKLNATSKGIITAYGAYGMSETPWFHSMLIDFVNQGNVYATAHVRGGGEKGPAWHKAGMKSTKENSWKDLIACSGYLIEKGYVSANKLGLNVNSAGAITGAMAINKRPDLFKVFTAFLPSLNIIRVESIKELDDSDSAFEFGSVTEPDSFKNLVKMDPVLNLSKDNKYPSTLLTIGFKDYLVSPSAAGKYIALLQSFNPSNDKPYLLDIKFDAEHDIDWVDDYARMLYFNMKELDD